MKKLYRAPEGRLINIKYIESIGAVSLQGCVYSFYVNMVSSDTFDISFTTEIECRRAYNSLVIMIEDLEGS